METASAEPQQQHTHDLPRVLHTSHATAIVVGTLIGSGIFLVPQEMMRATGSSGLVYLAWIVGGLLSLFGAMTYAELSTMLPYTGGEYVYLRGAYGDLTAFLYMWTWFAVAKPASIASVTTGLARTLAIFPAFRVAGGHGLSSRAGGYVGTDFCDRHDMADDRIELSRHQKGGRFSACLYVAQGRADPGDCRVLLCFERRATGEISGRCSPARMGGSADS